MNVISDISTKAKIIQKDPPVNGCYGLTAPKSRRIEKNIAHTLLFEFINKCLSKGLIINSPEFSTEKWSK